MRWLARFAALMMPLALAACSDGGAADDDESLAGEELGTFTSNSIISDAEAEDASALSASAIDSFLESKSSCLVDQTFGGKSVGQLFAAAAKKHKISPLFLLAHLQKESSLVSKQTCTKASLAKAFGCGCPDGGSCSSQYAGFDKQLECAASKTRSYLDDLDSDGATIAGWSVGKSKKTLDGRSISPKNRVTAALYTYTPWVGDKTASGNKAPFGNYLFWKIWAGYVKATGYQGPQSSPDSMDSLPDSDTQNTDTQNTDTQGETPADGEQPSTPGNDSETPADGEQPSTPGNDSEVPPDGESPSPGDEAPADPAPADPTPAAAGACCEATPGQAGCADDEIKSCVCAQDDYCCAVEWDASCVQGVFELGCGGCGI